ncbi:nucleotide-binding domain containing protein [Vibrio metschnikovii]
MFSHDESTSRPLSIGSTAFAVDVEACLRDKNYVQQAFIWVTAQLDSHYAPMVYATADPDKLKAIQTQYGAATSSEAVEQFFSQLAHQLQEFGVKNFIVAGGETVRNCNPKPWCHWFSHRTTNRSRCALGPIYQTGSLSLALKSGNFGDERFFEKAQDFYL